MNFSRLLTVSTAAVALSAGAALAQAPASAQSSATPAPAAAPATAPAAPQVVPNGDLMDTMRSSGQFKTFVKAVDATNLTSVLKTNKNLTVFAPTDAAFAALPAGELDRLMADKAALQKLVIHHVINARVDSTKIKGAKGPVTTVANDAVELDGSGDTLKADNATIVQPDVMAANGVLHVVDRVLKPGAATADAASAGAAASPASATAQASKTEQKQP